MTEETVFVINKREVFYDIVYGRVLPSRPGLAGALGKMWPTFLPGLLPKAAVRGACRGCSLSICISAREEPGSPASAQGVRAVLKLQAE